MYGSSEYYKTLYPESFRQTNLIEAIFFLFLFFLLMSLYYLYLRFGERRARMLIDNNEQEIGNEIDYEFHGNVLSYRLIIRKLNDTEWVAYKLFRSREKGSIEKRRFEKDH